MGSSLNVNSVLSSNQMKNIAVKTVVGNKIENSIRTHFNLNAPLGPVSEVCQSMSAGRTHGVHYGRASVERLKKL